MQMETKVIDAREPLLVCLSNFSGAKGDSCDERKKSLIEPFKALARKILYGGYIRVRNEYAIFISKVEFYYHEEGASKNRVCDTIVYHRDGRFINRAVPYFPIMTLHAHWSGFDITFEKPGCYRASALIRKYVVVDLKEKKFVELKTTGFDKNDKSSLVGKIILRDDPIVDDRSTYLQYYLNGFPLAGQSSCIIWQDIDNRECPAPQQETRKNAGEHEWGFAYKDKEKYYATLKAIKETICESQPVL